MNKPIDLLISTYVWLGEYYTSPMRLFGMKFNRIIPKIYTYCAKVLNISSKDVCGNNLDFEFYYN